MKVYIYLYFLLISSSLMGQVSPWPFEGGADDGYSVSFVLHQSGDSCYFSGTGFPDSLVYCQTDSILLTTAEFFADSYVWNTGSTSSSIWVTETGWYSVTTVYSGCSYDDSVYVWLTDEPVFSYTLTDASGPMEPNGAVEISLVSAILPVDVDWSPGPGGFVLEDALPGTYSWDLSDAAACSYTYTFVVGYDTCYNKYANIIEDTLWICDSGNVSISNVDSLANYMWNTGDTTWGIMVNDPGVYLIEASYPGCPTTTDSVVVLSNPVLTGDIMMNPASNYVYPDGSLTFMQTSGTEIDAYFWSNGETTGEAESLTPGIYSLEILDVHGCLFYFEDTVAETGCYSYYIQLGPDQYACAGDTLSVATTGSATGDFLWNDGSTDTINASAVPDTLIVSVTNGFCSFSDSVFLLPTVLPDLEVFISETSRPINADGAIEILLPGSITEGYSILWNTGDTTWFIDGLLYGNYSYILTDTVGCLFEEEVYLPFDSCYTPFGITISDTTNSSFTVSWTGPSAATYLASYKNITTGGSFITIPVTIGTTSVTIPASLGDLVKYRIKYSCGGITSQSPLINFQMPLDSVLRLYNYDFKSEVYPNPVTSVLHLRLDLDVTSIVLYNQFGEVVLREEINTNPPIHALFIEFLPSGLYTLGILNKHGQTDYRKIIKLQ